MRELSIVVPFVCTFGCGSDDSVAGTGHLV